MNNLRNDILEKAKQKGFANFNIDNPKTWCEKIQWLQINDNIDLRAKCADKIKVHEYSIEKLDKDICIPILKIYDNPSQLDFNELPDQFVLKCNHGWNMNIIIEDKSLYNEVVCQSKLDNWLNTSFGIKSIEIHYLKINRKCFAEKYIGNPLDYKFWCFNGNPKFCTVNSNIGSNGASNYTINWYDMNWNLLPYSRIDHHSDSIKLDKKPIYFNQMIEYAKMLSEDFRFVRVDFYEVNDTVYLGELTFTPATGFIKWTDPNIDRNFGDMIRL